MKQINYSSFSLLTRRTMEYMLADMYANIFPDYKQAHKEELARLRAMSDQEYSDNIKRIADMFAEMPCRECGCEVNGDHEDIN